MADPIVLVAIITQLGTLVGVLISARSARGAKSAATGAKKAATAAHESGQSEHTEQLEQLDSITSALTEIKRDVAGLRSEDRQTRRELHALRQKINRHLGLGD